MDIENTNNSRSYGTNICNWCGRPSVIFLVHNHGQCLNCGYNIDECCQGRVLRNSESTKTSEEENN